MWRLTDSTSSKAKSKYRSRACGGYHSAKEARRAQELKLLEQAGKIRGLREQVRYELLPKQEGERPVYYWSDFTYEELTDGNWVVVTEDTKGYRTKDYILKRKLFRWRYGYPIRET